VRAAHNQRRRELVREDRMEKSADWKTKTIAFVKKHPKGTAIGVGVFIVLGIIGSITDKKDAADSPKPTAEQPKTASADPLSAQPAWSPKPADPPPPEPIQPNGSTSEATPAAPAKVDPNEQAKSLCGKEMKFESYKGGVLTCVFDDGEECPEANLCTISGHSELKSLVAGFDSMDALKMIVVIEFAQIADKAGNSNRTKVAEFKVSRAKAKKINWDNVLLKNIPSLIDSAWMKSGIPIFVDG
jgi:hypothetical protein